MKNIFLYLPFIFLAVFSCDSKSEDDNKNEDEKINSEFSHKSPAYKRLSDAVKDYKSLAKKGGWPMVPEMKVALKQGDTSQIIVAIKERLTVTGDLQKDVNTKDPLYNEALQDAINKFQERHGITEDGVIGPGTISEMNVPVEKRIESMEQTLKAWRDLPENLGERFVMVNVPEFRLRAFENDEEKLGMKIIVGKDYDGAQTPLFNDEIRYLIINPYWNVPETIAKDEIVPKALEDKKYFDRNNFEIVDSYKEDAEVLRDSKKNLEKVKNGELYIRQKPGPANALGAMKFIFPNKEAIYLHGTPEDHLFDKTVRGFSHGCIRIEEPTKLAAFLLGKNKDQWPVERIQKTIASGEHVQVNLDKKVPVYIIYWTAYVDNNGTVIFPMDIYKKYSN